MATILVVDDQPLGRQFLATLLGYAGHRILEAATGAEALEQVRGGHPDLVITDLLMPTMDGYEFVRELRADPGTARTPVIFYTATYHDRKARDLAQAYGVRHLIAKPSGPDVILRAVSDVLGTPLPSGPPDPPGELGAEHRRLLSDKLLETVSRLEEVNRRLTALVNLGRQLALERDSLQLAESYCLAAGQIIGARYAAVGLLDDDGKGWRHFLVAGPDHRAVAGVRPPDPAAGLVGKVLAEKLPVHVADLGADPGAEVFLPPHPREGSFLGVAIASSSRTYGLLYLVGRLGGGAFNEEDEGMAATLAAQLGVAYKGLRQYEDVRRHTARLEQEVVQRKQVEGALQESRHRLQAIFDNAQDAVLLLDEQGRFIDANPAACALLGHSREEILARRLWDVTPAAQSGFTAGLWRTLLAAGRLSGEQTLVRKDGSAVEVEYRAVTNVVPGVELAVLRDVTERKQAEQAREKYAARLQALSRQLMHAQEAERRRIAGELHDEVGQTLTILQLTLDRCAARPPDAAQANLGEARALVQDLLTRVRELSLDLRPAMLDDLGLMPTLFWHFERYTGRTGVRVTLESAGVDRRFSPDMETAVFRIVQEALTNVARHAGVGEVMVRLWVDAAALHMQVADQGAGFDPAAVTAAGTSGGLVGMRERANLLGGNLTVESAPGAGTRVTAELPLARPPDPGEGGRST